jgi:hypothetical protein
VQALWREAVGELHEQRARHPRTWPVVLVRDRWASAVADDLSVRFNLRLLAALTALLSTPDLFYGLTGVFRHSGPARLYAGYVLTLGLLELSGGLLLLLGGRGPRRRLGARAILVAAVGFYLEAALGIAVFEPGLLSLAVFAVCVPAEAWVIWFLVHPRTRSVMRALG